MEQHQGHLRWVFEVFKKNQLYINGKKCVFGQRKVEYLGHVILQQGVAGDEAKV